MNRYIKRISETYRKKGIFMKKKAFLMGVLGIVLVLGLVITSCDNATGSDSSGNNSGSNNNDGNNNDGNNSDGNNNGGNNNGGNNNGGNNNNTTNPFTGTWTGSAQVNGGTSQYTVVITDNQWTMSYAWSDGQGGSQQGSESGTYTYSGTTATLSQGTQSVGTATVSGNTVSVTFTSGDMAGNYSLTKQ
jgi:hypothetical protein